MFIVSSSLCAFSAGFFIGFERPTYFFDEPAAFQTSIMEVALVTNRVPEQLFITQIALVQGSAMQDTGDGGDYVFDVERIVFLPGVRRQIVPFTLNPDTITEGTEDFQIRATRSGDGPAYGCVDPCISTTTIFIQDDDRKYYYLPF